MFESILKLISYRFGLGYLNKRHRYAFNIGRTFNWSQAELQRPGPARPGDDRRDALLGAGAAEAGVRRARAEGARPDALETSGYLDRSASRCSEPTYSAIFRKPDAVRKAVENAPISRAT